VHELATERLLLRRWKPADRAPFAELNADPQVMRYFPATLTRRSSDELADRIEAELTAQGWGLWALEERGTGRFLGFTGLAHPTFEASFMPAVEIGWRLARSAWGCGFATEAATAAATFAFNELALDQLVSFTTEHNARSRAVMERLGMRHDQAHDFDHPRVLQRHLRRHVLYRLTACALASVRGIELTLQPARASIRREGRGQVQLHELSIDRKSRLPDRNSPGPAPSVMT
jgi:RimJ/RimL family protein N-acetyltransferase